MPGRASAGMACVCRLVLAIGHRACGPCHWSSRCDAGCHASRVSARFSKEDIMSSANRMTTPVGLDEAQIEGRYARLEDYTVGFETYKEDLDPAPVFAGLPDDRCQCPHWGIVTAGQVTFRWADHDETYVEGDAYYAPPGHVPL